MVASFQGSHGGCQVSQVLLSAVTSVALVSSAFAVDIYTPSAPYWRSVALPPSSAWSISASTAAMAAVAAWGSGKMCSFQTLLRAKFVPYSTLFGSDTIAGGFGGGQLGYNFQFGSFVLGAEADLQGSNICRGAATIPFTWRLPPCFSLFAGASITFGALQSHTWAFVGQKRS